MKIGKFGKMNHLSIDTIRHYMDLGLVLPDKRGGHYVFDDQCQRDLELILEMKALGFSLHEIKIIVYYKNFGKFTNYETDTYYQSLFMDKYARVEQEIMKLQDIKDKLKIKIDHFSTKPDGSHAMMGIDLSVLGILKCPKCCKGFILLDAQILHNQIVEGRFACDCGEEYLIESGIMRKREVFHSTDELIIKDYIQETDPVYLEILHKSREWTKKKLLQLDLNNKVLLELGTGFGFFLRYIFQELPEKCVYISVDHNLQRHRFLKGVLESTGIKKNVIFICTDFLDIPLDKNSVDIVIDQSGTSNYSFEHEEFLLNSLVPLFKPECHLFGTFFVFKNFSHKSKIEARFRSNFAASNIIENLSRLQFALQDERSSDYMDRGGIYENFFVKGEVIYTYSFIGKRLG